MHRSASVVRILVARDFLALLRAIIWLSESRSFTTWDCILEPLAHLRDRVPLTPVMSNVPILIAKEIAAMIAANIAVKIPQDATTEIAVTIAMIVVIVVDD